MKKEQINVLVKNKLHKIVKNRFFLKLSSKVITQIYVHSRSLWYLILFRIPYKKKKLDGVNYLFPKIKSQTKEQTRFVSADNNRFDLSIIVPVYNVERYVKKCIESIIRQETFYSFEIIVIDDGSTDRSNNILQEYSKLNSFTLIDRENNGVSDARNIGLNYATGEYIMFVDPDDFIYPGTIETLLHAANSNNACIVECDFNYNKNRKISKSHSYYKEKEYQEKDFLCMSGYPWGKVVKRSLYDVIRFPVGYINQDTLMHFVIFRLCSKIIRVKFIGFEYRIHAKSITSSNKQKWSAMDTYFVVQWLIKQLEKHKDKIPFDQNFYRLLLMQFGHITFLRLRNFDQNVLEFVLSEYREILKCYSQLKPNNLSKKELLVEKSILTANIKLYRHVMLFL
jgi:glycosyltransferase involved in cell wall biosynthesis